MCGGGRNILCHRHICRPRSFSYTSLPYSLPGILDDWRQTPFLVLSVLLIGSPWWCTLMTFRNKHFYYKFSFYLLNNKNNQRKSWISFSSRLGYVVGDGGDDDDDDWYWFFVALLFFFFFDFLLCEEIIFWRFYLFVVFTLKFFCCNLTLNQSCDVC